MKKRHCVHIAFMFLIILSCKEKSKETKSIITSEKQVQVVDDKTINEFIEYCLKNDNGVLKGCKSIVDRNPGPYYLSKDDSLSIIKMDTIFTKDDIAFIYKQIKSEENFKLKSQYFKNQTIISADTLYALKEKDEKERKGSVEFWKEIYKRYGKGFCTINLPLFTKNREIVIVKSGYHCGGLCGEGATYILKKINSEWIIIATLDSWVS